MAREQNLQTLTFEAGADLSDFQYRAMVKDSSGQVSAPSAGARADGILQNAPDTQGQAASVAILGRSKAEAGAAFDADVQLTPGTNGKLVELGTGEVGLATSIDAATADGDVVAVILNPQLEAPT